MLDNNLKNQLAQYFDLLKTEVTIGLSAHNDENSKKVREFVEEVVALSDKISLVEKTSHLVHLLKSRDLLTMAG